MTHFWPRGLEEELAGGSGEAFLTFQRDSRAASPPFMVCSRGRSLEPSLPPGPLHCHQSTNLEGEVSLGLRCCPCSPGAICAAPTTLHLLLSRVGFLGSTGRSMLTDGSATHQHTALDLWRLWVGIAVPLVVTPLCVLQAPKCDFWLVPH